MLERIIQYSIHNKLIVLLFAAGIIGFGLYALSHIPIGAVPDVTNNQVQIITTSRNLATEDVEKFLTYPVELEMANLPGVKEIRSISKFGLSVVTVVFEENLGTYLPRQLIAEKIKSAEEKIPAGFGTPFMGPISTGLGEIYQYVIEVDPAYKDQYSLSDIRTIQDWVVRRQLSGIPGVVEVNTWGGFLKQYEVAVDPEKLRSLGLSLSQVFETLQKNNSIAGGGYIEKNNQSYFIRGEGLASSLEDIESIVVDNRNGSPVFIRDVARVGFGKATRFGAITGNGEGEKVLGQVMMLKGADSRAVIDAVKARVEEISPSLPPGISINAFLERSELIGKTTFTITENLILGCLIVVFVVVLLLGNFRSGLVVASVIPLSLLFALSLMYLFGIDANLMSLGAIDFGIIIDGAVIIVEYIAFKITADRQALMGMTKSDRRERMDQITFQGANKMMHSAVFGQLIIIIVFIPILSLVGVEGKMFQPMALAFCFALIGAMILCFTYVPVMAALFIKPGNPEKKTLSRALIGWISRRYVPTITWALHYKGLVIGLAILLLGTSVYLFSRMGGEFVPTLDEGDFVIQPVLKTGTSLSKTVEITTKFEQILKTFPEVEQVVTRIGAAEVPTDPMSMEESDVIIKLKPKSAWVTAETKDELADKFKEALSIFPGVDYEFTQPIEMRFNELITGVRADLAIKIFGEDLDILYKKALEVEKAIQGIEGAADISVEKVAGLPQMSVVYDRRKIAKYGLNVEELNDLISMGFAGAPAGMVFEGEKQFDLVLRYDPEHQGDIQDLEMATVMLPNGQQLPLSEFASISYTKGPAKISRDNTKRRIVVGVNVRNRDLESVVNDVQEVIEREVRLPVGYTIDYGGQFENLRTARQRLMVAVPVALVLIFVLLYFAFSSVKDALIIYSAIPMAAVGGVLLLYLRDMPFSISAGVGFIALFGIAVLNGIVLIEEFKELKAHGISDVNERIIKGTSNRLRPVLLTASAAALGFLPMAISTSAGAEVQRPLATVVVGGLITATLLTLLVLPVLYALFDGKSSRSATALLPLLFVLPLGNKLQAQQPAIDLNRAVEIALNNNLSIKASRQYVAETQELIGAAVNIDKTSVYLNRDQNNIAPNDRPLTVLGVSQAIRLPSVYDAQRQVLENEAALSGTRLRMDERQLVKDLSQAYVQVVYWKDMQRNMSELHALYQDMAGAAAKKFEAGASDYLQQLSAETREKDVWVQLQQITDQLDKSYARFYSYLQSDTSYVVSDDTLSKIPLQAADTTRHPGLQYARDAIRLAASKENLEAKQRLPDFEVSLFGGTNNGTNAKFYGGFQLGVSVPLNKTTYTSRIAAARIATARAETAAGAYSKQLFAAYASLQADINQYNKAVEYYETTGKTLSEQLVFHAKTAFAAGEIDFFQYSQLLEQARSINFTYLTNLLNYNLSVLEFNYLMN